MVEEGNVQVYQCCNFRKHLNKGITPIGGVWEFVSLFLQGTKESGPAFFLFVRGQ